jgi:transcription termination factor Rho
MDATDRDEPIATPVADATAPRSSAIEMLELGLLELSDLQKLSRPELEQVAAHLHVPLSDENRRHDLVVAILGEHVRKHGVLFGEGVAEILPDGFGFLRSPAYAFLPSPDDVYLSPALVERHELRTGMTVGGQLRPPRAGERYFTLLSVETIGGEPAAAHRSPVAFESLTPIHPDRRIDLRPADPNDLLPRVVDLVAPIGFGQRGLIVAPPRTGKTVLLQQLAHAIARNHPDVVLLMLLVDERPEEVTDMERVVDGEVVASTFDEAPARHLQVADVVLEKAKRLVESGRDVVLLLDSITRLARACNALAPAGGRILSGGVEANALQRPKRFFGSARCLEQGGSLTILATALVETGSRMDEVIFEEFKGTGNLEIVLDRRLADRRVFPAIDVLRSGTRAEERIVPADSLARRIVMRRALGTLDSVQAMELLLSRLRGTADNEEFLAKLHEGG